MLFRKEWDRDAKIIFWKGFVLGASMMAALQVMDLDIYPSFVVSILVGWLVWGLLIIVAHFVFSRIERKVSTPQ